MYIAIKDLVKQYGPKRALDGVTLHIEEGEFVALLGPSGCGKTTLLSALAGSVDVDGGAISVREALWSGPRFSLPPEKRGVGMVFQDFALWPHLSVFDNVAFGLRLRPTSTQAVRERVCEVLCMVDMESFQEQFPHQLSGGQKQRVAIARALAPRPHLMLMDEPLSSLDAKLREQMRWDLLKVVRQAGITTVYVTHDQVEALSMADRVVLLKEGRIEQEGSPTELYRHPRSSFAASFVGASNLMVGKVAGGTGNWTTVDCHGHPIRCATEHPRRIGESVTVMIRPNEIGLKSVASASDGAGTLLDGTIVARAFHGVNWQYRVEVHHLPRPIEVWHEGEHRVGDSISLWFPAASCRLLQESPAPVAVATGWNP